MKLTTMTVFIALFSLFEIVRMGKNLRDDRVGIKSALIWIGLWLMIMGGSLFPGVLDFFVELSQMGFRLYFVFIVSILALFALVFNMNTRLEKMQRDISRLVEENAIMRYRFEYGDPGSSTRPEILK